MSEHLGPDPEAEVDAEKSDEREALRLEIKKQVEERLLGQVESQQTPDGLNHKEIRGTYEGEDYIVSQNLEEDGSPGRFFVTRIDKTHVLQGEAGDYYPARHYTFTNEGPQVGKVRDSWEKPMAYQPKTDELIEANEQTPKWDVEEEEMAFLRKALEGLEVK